MNAYTPDVWIGPKTEGEEDYVVLRIISDTEIEITPQNILFLYSDDSFRSAHFKPIEISVTEFQGNAKVLGFETIIIYEGNTDFLKNNYLTDLKIQTVKKDFSFPIELRKSEEIKREFSNANSNKAIEISRSPRTINFYKKDSNGDFVIEKIVTKSASFRELEQIISDWELEKNGEENKIIIITD